MAGKIEIDSFYFPYPQIRDVQKELMQKIWSVIEEKQNLIVHAPTGLGKTVAALCPALKYASKHNLTVFFLTSRHTQHFIAVDTLRQIREKFGLEVIATDIIGKKWMCPVPGVEGLYSGDFADYCKSVRDEGKCEFFQNTWKGAKLTKEAGLVLSQIIDLSPCHSERIAELCSEYKLCPYEMTTELAKASSVVIADYYYVFHPQIRQLFFKKAGKSLPGSIIIVDEGHNLPARLRNLMTEKLSDVMLDNAIREAKKHGYEETQANLENVRQVLHSLSEKLGQERECLVIKEDFTKRVAEFGNYDELIADFRFIGEAVMESEKRSYILSVAGFMEAWLGDDNGFVRILNRRPARRDREILTLSYRCLDPSLVSRQVISEASSTIMMSGTLTPMDMYRDILGFPKAELAEFSSPFPKENRLNLVIPTTTTKFTERSERQFQKIAEICADISNLIPGNMIIYFPSYEIRDKVMKTFVPLCKKTVFSEHPEIGKDEKKELMEKFKSYKDSGAVLLAVVSGSFGEGIDLPGDYLNAVIVVGLPLSVPDLETKALIKYYDKLFSKGWDYGYVFPAMNKVMQNAGRVIRSETDRGAIAFLDERYGWHQYARCFPQGWELVTTVLYQKKIKDFFAVR